MLKKSPKNHARFRIGDAMVYPDRLTISMEGKDHSVEPKVMEVLIALAEASQNDEVLSAELLFITVWRGKHEDDRPPKGAIAGLHSVFSDNPVHKAITSLRKVFNDDPKAPKYIETIRKRGYRLIARVIYPDGYRHIAMRGEDWKGGCPYVGLNAFDAEHASVFLGRRRTTTELLTAMRRQIDQQQRLVLVVGASGCGKTSLINAGAIPLLTQDGGFDGLRALSVARCDLAGTVGNDTIERICASLMQWSLGGRAVFPPQSTEWLARDLRSRPDLIKNSVTEAFKRHHSRGLDEQPQAHLLLVIDHAEALVAAKTVDINENAVIERILKHLCDTPRICVILIIRGDFYLALAEAFPGITERKAGDGHLDVLTPRTGEISEIIRVPAATAGLSFQRDPVTGIHLDDALRDAAIAQPDALPLLQYTLQMLYERRNGKDELLFETYRDIGGLEGALAHHAEHVFGTLPEGIRSSLGRILSRIVVMQPENESISGRSVKRNSLDNESIALAEAFVKARLFVAEHENGGSHYRVTHEALLRQWPRATDWISENRRLLVARIRLQRAAKRWSDEGRHDDHLISSRSELEEALAAADASCDPSLTHEQDFLELSRKIQKQRSRFRSASILLLAAMALTTSVLWLMTRNANLEAAAHRRITQRISANILGELTDAIRPTNKLELLDLIATEALVSLSVMDIDALDETELLNHARSLRIAAEVKIKQGQIPAARKALLTAIGSAHRSASGKSTRISATNEIGQILYHLGYCDYQSGNLHGATNYWKEYLRNSDMLISTEPGNPEWLIEKSYAVDNLGTIEKESENFESATRLFSQSATLKMAAIRLSPSRSEWIKDLTDTRSKISSINESIGNLAESARQNAQDQSALRLATGHDPSNVKLLHWLANALARSASLAETMGDTDGARALITESISILNRTSTSSAMDSSAKRDLAYALMKSGDIAISEGQPPNALLEYQRALSTLSPLLANGGQVMEWNRLNALIRLRILRHESDIAIAEAEIRRIVAELDGLQRSAPNERSAHMAAIEGRIVLSALLVANDRREIAMPVLSRAISDIEPLARERNTRIASAWVALHELRGTPEHASAQAQWLNQIGFEHSASWTTASHTTKP
jgi:eukaryotic-like serine/threonine-protein kinase